MPADSDTKKYLEDVKKGKPRRFVMICKGVKILSLIVFKKGTVEKYKKQAKEEGKGLFYHGVVDGKGVDITFKLRRSDGFEQPPGKELVLKEFLKSEIGMKFKPTYEIVDELPTVGESEDDECSAPAPENSSSDVPADHAALTTKLAEALKRLKPLVDKIIEADPDRTSELQATMVRIAGEIKSQQFDQAKQNITDFAALLKPRAEPQSPQSAESVDRMDEYVARCDALEPILLAAQKADREKATKLGAVWDHANAQADAGNFDNAFTALDRLQSTIKQLTATATSDPREDAIPQTSEPEFSEFWQVPEDFDAMANWQQVRAEAVVSLKAVAVEVTNAQHAESNAAVIELNAVIKNLTPKPESLQQVAELQRYLVDDEVVEDVCELAEDIRTPLMDALESLEHQLSA